MDAMDRASDAISAVLLDRSTSNWLRSALFNLMERDPCDAAADAEVLHRLIAARTNAILGIK